MVWIAAEINHCVGDDRFQCPLDDITREVVQSDSAKHDNRKCVKKDHAECGKKKGALR